MDEDDALHVSWRLELFEVYVLNTVCWRRCIVISHRHQLEPRFWCLSSSESGWNSSCEIVVEKCDDQKAGKDRQAGRQLIHVGEFAPLRLTSAEASGVAKVEFWLRLVTLTNSKASIR